VTTSPWGKRDGLSSDGLSKLQSIAAAAGITYPSILALLSIGNTAAWPNLLSLGYKSK
jgi:hypothetical protein